MNKDVFLIAEIGQAHDGSLGILHSYIDALADTGIDAIKFQTHIAEAESSDAEPFRINFSYEDKTRYEYWQRMSFSKAQWGEIKQHCDERDLEFMSSPFSQAAVDLLESIDVKRYKIGSGEVNNFLMLDKIARTGKPIILSSGMSSFAELDATMAFLTPFGNKLSILQCTTSYPTTSKQLGLNVITELIDRYPKATIGFSDHSANIATGTAAVALGAKILEFHAVFDQRMFGPDAKSSLTIDQITQLVDQVRFISTGIQHPIDKNDNSKYLDLKMIFEKTLAINKNLPKGHLITFDDLEAKKPAQMGVDAQDFRSVIGRTLTQNMSIWSFLKDTDFE